MSDIYSWSSFELRMGVVQNPEASKKIEVACHIDGSSYPLTFVVPRLLKFLVTFVGTAPISKMARKTIKNNEMNYGRLPQMRRRGTRIQRL